MLKNCKYHIGNAKMLGLEPDQYARRYADENKIDDYVRVYRQYEEHLKENNALDFDDLLLYARRLLLRDEEVRTYLPTGSSTCSWTSSRIPTPCSTT